MAIDHNKHRRLKRQLAELDGAHENATGEVEFLRYGIVSADGSYVQEPGVIPSILRRLSLESPFNLPYAQRDKLRALVAEFDRHMRGVDRSRMKLSEAQVGQEAEAGRALVDAYDRLADAQAHLADINARRAPLTALVRRLDAYVGFDHGLTSSLGVVPHV